MVGACFEPGFENFELGRVDRQRRCGQCADLLHQPAHGLLLLFFLKRNLVDIEVEKVALGVLLALDLALEVVEAVLAILHRLLDGDLEVLDPALFVVLGLFDVLGDVEKAAVVVAVAEADRLNAVGIVADEFALAQQHAGGVDIFADDDKGAFGAGDIHFCSFLLPWWSLWEKVLSQALVPLRPAFLITAGPSSMCSSSP